MRLKAGQEKMGTGFTLLELVVSASLVLVLASLTLPAINSARAKAQRVQCLENQRQIILGWSLFAGDHSGRLPANGYTPGGGDPANPLWVQGYMNPKVAPDDAFDEKLLVDSGYAQLGQYVSNPAVYRCPSDRDSIEVDGRTRERARSYSMNAYVGWQDSVQRPLTPGYRVFNSWSDMDKFGPAKLMVLLDVNPESICWPFFGVNMGGGEQAQFFAYPGASHDNGAMVAFADGHVEYHSWTDERTSNPGNVLFHGHDTSSPSNPDLAWLRARTSSNQ